MSIDAGDRGRGAGAGDLHADRRFPARLSRPSRPSTSPCSRATDGRSQLPRLAVFRAARIARWPRRARALVPPAARRLIDEQDVDAELPRGWSRRSAKRGCWAHASPAPHGGGAARARRPQPLPCRELLAYHAGLADFAFAMQGLGTGPITLFGTEAQKARTAAGRGGEAICGLALTEPEAGSDAAAIGATARREGDAFVLDGDKTWISNGGIADHYVVFARTGEAPGAKGISALIVDADTPGLTVAARLEAIAPHPLAALRFEGVPRARRQPARRRRRRLQDRDGDARRLPRHRRRRGAGLRPPGAGRGARPRRAAPDRRPAARRPADEPGAARRHGDSNRCRGAAGLPRRLGQGPGAARITREAAIAKLFATEAAHA